MANGEPSINDLELKGYLLQLKAQSSTLTDGDDEQTETKEVVNQIINGMMDAEEFDKILDNLNKYGWFQDLAKLMREGWKQKCTGN